MAGLLFAADYVLEMDFGQWGMIVPVLTFALRQAEGIADKIDPAKQRRRDVLREAPQTDADGNPPS
jgi:hypothetical protein